MKIKKKIKPGHPRYGAQIGDVVNGWRCTHRYFDRGPVTTWRMTGEASSIRLQWAYDDPRWGLGEVRAVDSRGGVWFQFWYNSESFIAYSDPHDPQHFIYIDFPANRLEASIGSPDYERSCREFVESFSRLFGFTFTPASVKNGRRRG